MAKARSALNTSVKQDAIVPGRMRRITALLGERDWIGIGIEFAAITLGILLAFQIDQWGQDRRQAREERQFLERMWRETAVAIRENDWALGLHARIRMGTVEGFRQRNNAVALAQLAAIPGRCGLTSFAGLGFNDTSYEELIASGRLNIISDPDLRADLRDVAAAQADSVTQLNYSRSAGIPIQQAVEPYYIRRFDENGNTICRTDWTGLVKDQNALSAMMRGARFHMLMWQKRAYTRDTLAKAHNRIACQLGKPDCVANVPQIIGYRPMSDTLPAALARKSLSPTGK